MTDKTTTSFMRSLCMGQIEQDVLFPFPTLAADQKEMLHEIAGALEDLLGPHVPRISGNGMSMATCRRNSSTNSGSLECSA